MSLRSALEPFYEAHLMRQCVYRPRHIAIIQDGNRRYAMTSGLDTADGHRAGADVTEKVLDWVHELGISHITLYSFSTENFNRDPCEIESLFTLFKEKFMSVLTDDRVSKYRIRVRMVGDRRLLPDDLKTVVEMVEEATKENNSFFLNIALAYGGRNEILHAARRILKKVSEGACTPEEITPQMVESHLHEGGDIPPVDLIIRTGNEYRTSNFLPWLANGHESAVYFSAPYWPMFRKIDLLRAIRVYSQRKQAGISAQNA
ncbi:MAG: polyprenyl diphosphate synthase [Methanoregulaceae archaeon]|nr:polyprenyl diphosphate synthase [Methanoregulaceae archaeon]